MLMCVCLSVHPFVCRQHMSSTHIAMLVIKQQSLARGEGYRLDRSGPYTCLGWTSEIIVARFNWQYVGLDHRMMIIMMTNEVFICQTHAGNCCCLYLSAITQDDCENYVRVISKLTTEDYYVCGTNAFRPLCRLYSYQPVSSHKSYREQIKSNQISFNCVW